MAAAKKRRSKKAASQEPVPGLQAFPAAPGFDVLLQSDDASALPEQEPDTGIVEVPMEDGSFEIDFNPKPEPKRKTKFDDNLAEELDYITLTRVSRDLLEAIEQDDRDRADWLQQRADGLELLGLKVEKPGDGNVGSSSTAVPGQSTVRDGLLSEAIFRFQANSFAELCPSDGPVKVVNYGDGTTDADKLAEDFEKDLNYYLTGSGPNTAKEYYPDTRKMLWWVGYASGMFKKVYRCPLRNRPVSESVDGSDLIVPSNATDLHNAGRITHQISMRQGTMKRMQILGAYRNVALTAPTPHSNPLVAKEGTITGLNPNQTRDEDQDYTVYECYCELDLEGFEHKDKKGEPTGLPLPYKVSIDKDSQTILEIRRNWKEPEDKDDTTLPIAKIPFVLFPYATGMGFYGTGLLHQLGNYTMALTAMLRISLDSGMYANYPGFLFAKPMGRQLQNEFRVPPGGGAPIDTSAVGGDINKAVMPLPYKNVDGGFMALRQAVREDAARYGGTAESPTGEGVANAPVGSVLAAIDQATRIEGGVHKALYAAQREELELLKELFREDPEALWRGNRRPAMGANEDQRRERFKQALENCDLVPASDPNVPSHMHRLAKATAYVQLAQQNPGVFVMQNVMKRWAAMVKLDGIEADFAPQGPPPSDPIAEKTLALKGRELDIKDRQLQVTAQKAEADRVTKENVEATKLAAAHLKAGSDAAKGQQQPDPMAEKELALKQQQVDQKGHQIVLDAANAHADRQARMTEKSMDIASRLATHPESQPVVNSEMSHLSDYMTPPQRANGGEVDDGGVDLKLGFVPMSGSDLQALLGRFSPIGPAS